MQTLVIDAAIDSGYVWKGGEGWPPWGKATVVIGAPQVAIQRIRVGRILRNAVGLARWPTSELEGLSIISAVLRVHFDVVRDPDGGLFVAEYYSPAWPIDEGDYIFDVRSTAFSTYVGDLRTGYVDIPLSNPEININKTGYTALRFGILDVGRPTSVNAASFSTVGDTAPKLVIEVEGEPFPVDPFPFEAEEVPSKWVGVLSLAVGLGLVGMIVYQASRREPVRA